MADKMGRFTLLLILTAAFSHKVAVSKKLDMAPNAVDDQYKECRDQMFLRVTQELLGRELNTTEGFNNAWKQGNCPKVIPGGDRIHTNALAVFGHNKKFRNTFNDKVETLGGNVSVYNQEFQFKSFHFLLMDSFRLLKPAKCRTVYRGVEKKYAATVGSEVRFGRFTSAGLKHSAAVEDSSDGTVFNITTCSAINLYENSCEPSDVGSWLIPPAEEFTVDAVDDVEDKDDNTYRQITLRSFRMASTHDCYYTFPSPSHRPPTTPPPHGSSAPRRSAGIALLLLALSASMNMGAARV